MEMFEQIMNILKFIYQKILLNQIVLSFFSGFMGALIAGGFSWLATKQSHENNIELEKLKEKETERAVVLSIAEELKVLFEIYGNDMEVYFETLQTENDYLQSYYIATLDFFTVFSNNADKIGIISNNSLRNLIVKIYVYLKRFLENFNLLRMFYDELHDNELHDNKLYDNEKIIENIRTISHALKSEFYIIKATYNLIIKKVDSLYKDDENDRK